MDAYQRAIRACCPDKVVCEIGVGLGPLSLIALREGAARVYGVEIDRAALETATAVVRSHGYDASRFIPVLGLSTQVQLPERVDVILSETLDSTGFGENTATYMTDARERFLKPDGIFIPSHVSCLAALASPRTYLRQLRFWQRELADIVGLHYDDIIDVLRSHSHVLDVEEEDCFSGWKSWREMDFQASATEQAAKDLLLEVTRGGSVHGIACAFEATLSPGVTIRNLPWDPVTCWKQGFNPFEGPMDLEVGDAAFVQLWLPETQRIQIQFEMAVTAGPSEAVRALAKAS